MHVFNWSAYVTQFLSGNISSTTQCYLNSVLGFEFESKIVPLAVKNMFEQLTVGLVSGAISIGGIQGKTTFRYIFLTMMLLGQFSVVLQLLRFKNKDNEKVKTCVEMSERKEPKNEDN